MVIQSITHFRPLFVMEIKYIYHPFWNNISKIYIVHPDKNRDDYINNILCEMCKLHIPLNKIEICDKFINCLKSIYENEYKSYFIFLNDFYITCLIYNKK